MDTADNAFSTTPSTAAGRVSAARFVVAAAAFALILVLRTWDISRHTWMLGDQIRDWAIALGPFRDLPLVGPPTHVGGYTIGPAFYWLLWAIRVTVGPWFENLPHGGGIGQAIVQSAADAVLLLALWHRTRSGWIAVAATVLIATASYDLCLSAIVWNPMMGSALAKMATAVVLSGWTARSSAAAALAAALVWCAVQCYTGAIFVAVGILLALLVDPLMAGDRTRLARHAWIIALVVAALQVPHVLHQLAERANDSGMGAVTGSVGNILTGKTRPQFGISWRGLTGAFSFIQMSPWPAFFAWAPWMMAISAVVVTIRHRRDLPLLAALIVPQVAAVLGYALYVGDFLDHYYYFSLMPAAVITVLLAASAVPWAPVARAVSIAALIGAVVMVPARVRFARTMHQMPEYGLLLDASRAIVSTQQPVRAIRTAFALQPSADPEFIYTILGGRLDRTASRIAIVKADGSVEYQQAGGV